MSFENKNDVVQDVEAWLRFMKRIGVEYISKRFCLNLIKGINPPNFSADKDTNDKRSILSDKFDPGLKGYDKTRPTWGRILNLSQSCKSCSLAGSNHGPVMGIGPSDASVMVIGSFPSSEDEMSGRPFSGPDGNLLSKMLGAINLSIDRVFLTLAVKCRPPGGRKPDIKEIEVCGKELMKELRAVDPDFVLLLGEVALKAFYGVDKSFASSFGRLCDRNGYKVMSIYHPSFLLGLSGEEQKSHKKKAWVALQEFERSIKSSVF